MTADPRVFQPGTWSRVIKCGRCRLRRRHHHGAVYRPAVCQAVWVNGFGGLPVVSQAVWFNGAGEKIDNTCPEDESVPAAAARLSFPTVPPRRASRIYCLVK